MSSEVIGQVVEQNLLQAAKVVEEQLDAELKKLDDMDDVEMEAFYQRRLDAMKKQMKQKNEWLQLGHGEYSELTTEKEFFDACKKSQNFVCHFYRDSTFRCKIVDKHLSALAPKHLEARFCKINAEKSPFLTEKLKIRVLPTITLCKDNKVKDYIIGFDDLGGTDEFPTEMLEWRIGQTQVINYNGDLLVPPDSKKNKKLTVFGHKSKKTIRGGPADTDSDED